MAIPKYIQDPNNPNASIPNPAYDPTRTQAENNFNQANLGADNLNKATTSSGVTETPKIVTGATDTAGTTTTEEKIMPKVSTTPLADLGLDFTPTESEKEMEKARQGILSTYPTEAPNEGEVRKRVTDEFQAQIDALELAKRQKAQEIEQRFAKQQAQRLGSSRAILAGSGMLGQVGGETVQQGIISDVESKRMAELGTLESEAERKRLELLGTARKAAEDQIKAKNEAFRQRGETLISYLKEREGTKRENTKKFVENAVASGVDLSKEDLTEYAKSLGVSKNDILSEYRIAKASQVKLQSEQAKAEAERLKTEAETGKIKAEAGIIPLTGEKVRAETAKTNAEIYKLQHPEKQYNNIKEVNGGLYDADTNKWLVEPKANYSNIKEVDGGLYDLETRTWLVPSKNPQDEYILDKDGRVFNKTKGVYSDTGTTTPAVTNTDTTKIDQSIATIDEILKPDKFLATNLPGVGSNIIARFDPVEGVTGKTQEFIGKVEQLVKDLALQNLIKSKGEGATFGALSEGELKLLMETASPISKWAIKDDKGNVIGYDIDQASFRRELERIKENLTAQKNKASQGTKDITANKSLSDMAIELGYSKEELKEALQTDSYDTVMNMIKDKYKSKNISGGGGTPTASSIGSAITAQESGGNYRAVNKDSGALGAHQIMPFHLPKIGLTTSTADQQKFLNSPELQDKLQAMIIDENIKNYGSKEKAIAAYYGGGLAAKNYGTKQGDIQGKYDALGRPTGYPSVNEYVSQVLSRLNA